MPNFLEAKCRSKYYNYLIQILLRNLRDAQNTRIVLGTLQIVDNRYGQGHTIRDIQTLIYAESTALGNIQLKESGWHIYFYRQHYTGSPYIISFN